MRTILFVALAALFALSATAYAADNAPPEGFTALFNGKDFAGWSAKQGGEETDDEKAKWQQHWKVEDGVIKFDGKGPNLWTAGKYGNFVLMVDWRFLYSVRYPCSQYRNYVAVLSECRPRLWEFVERDILQRQRFENPSLKVEGHHQ